MQAATEDTDISLSNLSCRILVVSPTVEQAKSCIRRMFTYLYTPPSI